MVHRHIYHQHKFRVWGVVGLRGASTLKVNIMKGAYMYMSKVLTKLTYEYNSGSLLTHTDIKTLLVLFSLWEEQGKNKRVSFTEPQLLEKINMGDSQYPVIRESLENLSSTKVVVEETTNLEKGKRIERGRYDLFIANKITEDEDGQGKIRSRFYEIEFSEYTKRNLDTVVKSLSI